MSILNTKLNTIFTHVPRVAGSSVSEILGGQGHKDIIYFKRFCIGQSDIDFNNLFKFAFVRDPYTRFVSGYRWYKENYEENKGINNFAIDLKKEYETWKEDDLRALIFKPQWQFICNQYYTPQVDFVGRYENLKDDWRYVADKLGIKDKLPHKNKSKKNDIYLTSKTKDIIYELYQKDFDTFDFKRT